MNQREEQKKEFQAWHGFDFSGLSLKLEEGATDKGSGVGLTLR